MQDYHESVYLISVVSKMLNIHPQTLRQYEKEGLITPGRSEGKIRLYSQYDIDVLKTILTLTRDLGLNLAGVDIVLKLQRQVKELEADTVDLRNIIHKLNPNSVVPSHKSIVTKQTENNIIIFKE